MKSSVFLATGTKGLARAEGQDDDWTVTHLLSGVRINCLAVDPLDRRQIYAGTQENGVLCSSDWGQSWQPTGLSGLTVKSLAVSSHRRGLLYAGTKPAYLYTSADGGATWTELSGFRQVPGRWKWLSPAEWPFQAYVQAIALSPTDSDVLLAGIEAGAVVRSDDGGHTWSGHRAGADRDCHSMTFHATDGDWIYEGGGGGPAVSQDGGRSWHHPTEGLDGRYCWACAGDPQRPEVWYVSAAPMIVWPNIFAFPTAHYDGKANAAIYRRSGGASWQKLQGGLPQPLDYMAYSLLTDPAAPGHLYAGLSNGDVWHSSDYGEGWLHLPFNLGGIHRQLIRI
ncbi:MAG: hypothetical protein R3300_00585 [Candidatus Promineifilaceae bacterium]|nr:hypothetical protein [Candidatus Promineifilaceae bacterium]